MMRMAMGIEFTHGQRLGSRYCETRPGSLRFMVSPELCRRNFTRLAGVLALVVLGSAVTAEAQSAAFVARRDLADGVSPNDCVSTPSFGDGGASSLAVAKQLGNGGVSFEDARNLGAGFGSCSVAIGDFNGDGVPDLVVANSAGPYELWLLLGNGDGTFQAARTFTSGGESPVSLAVGDFNGDGIQDLAVANMYADSVSVLLGNRDGIFRGPVSFGAGDSPRSVAVGDFDGDGIQDLAVANSGRDFPFLTPGSVSVLLGNGDGTFQAAQNHRLNRFPWSVAVGDFNRDGKLDVAVVTFNSDSVGVVLLGNGDGTFQAERYFGTGIPGNFPASVAVGDFNGDGLADLAVAGPGAPPAYYDGSVSVLLGNGDGTFQGVRHYDAGAGPFSVAVGDFNGDGLADLAVANEVSDNVSVLLGQGDGTFQAARSFGAGLRPAFVVVGDLNGDGLPDLAVANFSYPAYYPSTVSVFINNTPQ
jgi:VCBS repeat protein/FG-GAP repeat protein